MRNEVRFSFEGASRDVDDGQCVGPTFSGELERRQGICSLSALRDEDDERLCIQQRIAITKFAGHLCLYGQVRLGSDELSGDHPRMVGTAAGDDRDLPVTLQVKCASLFALDAGLRKGAQGPLDRIRSFTDLLHHEMIVSVLLDGMRIHHRLLIAGRSLLPICVDQPDVGPMQDGDLLLFEDDIGLRIGEKGQDITGDI